MNEKKFTLKEREMSAAKLDQSEFSKQIADAYNESGKKYHEMRKGPGLFFNEFLEVPAVLSSLPNNLSHHTVLDAGCGSGLYSVRLAKLGAKVFGVDLSETMIQIANSEKPSDLDISYQVGDICKTGFGSDYFDMIVSNYVLENVTDLSLVFSEFARVLKVGGTLFLSVSHPIRAMANREQKGGTEFWNIDHYFSGGIRVSDFGNGLKVPKFKYTLSDYIHSAAQAGFIIEDLYEPRPIASGKERDPLLYDLGCRLPQLMILKLRRK